MKTGSGNNCTGTASQPSVTHSTQEPTTTLKSSNRRRMDSATSIRQEIRHKDGTMKHRNGSSKPGTGSCAVFCDEMTAGRSCNAASGTGYLTTAFISGVYVVYASRHRRTGL